MDLQWYLLVAASAIAMIIWFSCSWWQLPSRLRFRCVQCLRRLQKTTPSTKQNRCQTLAKRWQLSPLERRVIELLASGMNTKLLAQTLAISHEHANIIIRRISAKAGCDGRYQLATKLRQTA